MSRVSPVAAAVALLEAIPLCLSRPELRRLVFRAVLWSAAVFAGTLVALLWAAFAVTGPLVTDGAWLGTVGWLARLLAIAAALLIAPPLFALLAGLVHPLFLGRIYDEARRQAGAPVPDTPLHLGREARILTVEVRRLLRFLLWAVLLLPLNLVPGIGGLLYLAAQLLLSARTLGWDLLSYHFELHRLSYAEQTSWVRAHRALVLSLGLGATLLLLVPVAQIFFLSSNVAAAGLVSARLDRA
jgi:uncharacterized protein involved in cysteine biosynthesis